MTVSDAGALATLQWFTRGGALIESSKVFAIDLAKGRGSYTYVPSCSRCGGAGRSEAWAHTGSICYLCNGSCHGAPRVEAVYLADRLAKLNESAKKRNEKKAEKAAVAEQERRAIMQEQSSTWVAEHADLLAGMRKLQGNNFVADLLAKVDDLMILTERQMAAAQKCIEDSAKREVERASIRQSEFVGTVGERRDFDLQVLFIHNCTDYDSFPVIVKHLYACNDGDGNSVVYVGSFGGMPETIGERVTVRATIKAHRVRDGVNQTIINRPALVAVKP